MGASSPAGVSVTASTSLGLTAVYRAVSIISGTVASLPLKSHRHSQDGARAQVATFLDNPGGPDGLTPYEWTETVVVSLLLWGNAYLMHVRNAGGALIGLLPIHPSFVVVEADKARVGAKRYRVSLADGSQRELTSEDLTHIPALSTDGLVGLSPITVARHALGTAIAGDQAAARMFGNGLLLAGLVTSEDGNLTLEEGKEIKSAIKAAASGPKHAGDILVTPAHLKFTPWSMNAIDAQFIESRAFGVNEVARLFGVPKVLLAEDGASTWGAGIAMLLNGMERLTLSPLAKRIEQRLSRLLPRPVSCEYEFAGLLRGTPEQEINLLLAQIAGGLLTVDEARRIRNLPPLPAGLVTEEAS